MGQEKCILCCLVGGEVALLWVILTVLVFDREWSGDNKGPRALPGNRVWYRVHVWQEPSPAHV